MLVNASICWKRRVLDVSYLINVIERLNVGNELVAYLSGHLGCHVQSLPAHTSDNQAAHTSNNQAARTA
jgi:hypothetical protein